MSSSDLRFVIPIIINLLKSQSEAPIPWDWDPFNILNPNEFSLTKIFFHVFLLLLSSFTYMTLSLTPPPHHSALIRFEFGNFSPLIAVSLVCSLVFPQVLFWFMSPVILVLISSFLGWVNVKLFGALPVWNIHIISTLTHYDREETNIDILDSQVSIAIFPQDHDTSPAEACRYET